MNEITKRLHIYMAVGALEMVRSLEEDENPKSARAVSLQNLINNSIRVGDFYNINQLAHGDQEANKLLDDFYTMVQRKFAPRTVSRDSQGRFCKVEEASCTNL